MSKADLSKKPEQVAAMFDEVAPTYDKTNDLLSFGQSRLWRGIVAKAVDPRSGQSILDMAAGTGSSTVAFARPGVRLVAGDFSEGMLAEGRKRHPEIEFVFADATKLPFKAKEFDATTISFGLRNVVDVEAALSEMFRVTKPGGRIVILTFHSGEDRRVKKSFQQHQRDGLFSSIADEVIIASPEERRANPRSIPAKLRWALRA